MPPLTQGRGQRENVVYLYTLRPTSAGQMTCFDNNSVWQTLSSAMGLQLIYVLTLIPVTPLGLETRHLTCLVCHCASKPSSAPGSH